ncbi:hypothetical protein D3C80_871860 [compost metagenome]
MPLKYVPLAADGFKREIVCNTSNALSYILSASNDALPIEVWMIPVLSTLKSILPPFTSVTALPTSVVTVPVLGLGIKFLGPKIRPNLPTLAITLGIVIMISTSVQPPSILLM